MTQRRPHHRGRRCRISPRFTTTAFVTTGGCTMTAMHCHFCGGGIPHGAKGKYLPPRENAQLALTPPHPCTRSPPIVYEHSPPEPGEGATPPPPQPPTPRAPPQTPPFCP